MEESVRKIALGYRLLVFIASLAILVMGSFVRTASLSWAAAPAALIIAALYCFPLVRSNPEITLIQVFILGLGIIYGPITAGWSAAFGIALGYAVRQSRAGAFTRKRLDFKPVQFDAAFQFGVQVLPLTLAFNLSGWMRTSPNDLALAAQLWPEAAGTILLFGLFHCMAFSLALWLDARRLPRSLATLILTIVLADLIPLPFVLVNLLAYPQLGAWSLVTLAFATALIAILINRASIARFTLERRMLDLSTLNRVSQVMQSTLDLENLLGVIHLQVTQLLKVDNFYVALVRPAEQQIWYPLAVKHGKRQEWPARSMQPDRLTDRVIHEGKSIFLQARTKEELDRAGLPASEETPHTWMGVPLITPERTIGCLAVYSISPDTQFAGADLNLLTILSGQVSVAIENALLLGQARQRAHQLETLNRLSGLMTASLDLREVLDQVCRSVIQVGGCQRSAIYLVDPVNGDVSLAHAIGLSAEFARANKHFSVAHNGRMRCLRTGRPVMVPSLELSSLDLGYADSLKTEGIAAYAEFPLATPDGSTGFLGAYFNEAHNISTKDVELLQTFASQAALAVSNARLYAHTDLALSRRAHQLTILESVGRELAAAINSDRLFEMILTYALEFTNSLWGELSLYNPERRTLEVKATRGYPATRLSFDARDGLAGRAAATMQVVNISEVSSEPEYIDLTGGKSRSKLCVPLVHEGRVMGVLALESDQANAYSSNDQGFISQLATQGALAVVNAQLYSETQRRLREQSILYLVTTHLVGNQPIEMVLQTLARSMEAAVQQESSIGIYLWEEGPGRYVCRYRTQLEGVGCGLPQVIAHTDLEPLRTALAKTKPLRLIGRKGQDLLGSCQNCQALVFPMIASQQRQGMALMHVPKEQPVHDEELQLLRTIVAQVSLSLQNALLFADVRHGRDRMATVLNSVGEGILMMETNGRIMVANEFILSLTRLQYAEITNLKLCDLPEPALKSLGYSLEEAQSLITGGVGHTPKKTIQGSDARQSFAQQEKILERTTAPVLDQSGHTIGWLIILRDVTEEHQLDQAREMITSTLIHDLRSPVGAVLSALEIVNTSLPTERQDIVDQGLRVARNGATRVLSLVDSLLDIARMEAGKMDLLRAPLDLSASISSAVADLQPQAKEYKIDLDCRIADSLPMVFADQSKIARVMSNLLDNALKFTPGGGQVAVTAEALSTGEVQVKVLDTGPGVPPEYRDKIFERFSTIPGQRARRRGSGLGLTFCKMAVEAHGGRMWMEDRPDGNNGSVFAFTLPRMAQEPAARESSDPV